MRGQQERTGPLFSYISTEDRIPATHPLRQLRRLADQSLDRLNPTFCKLYPEDGRPSIPPEQLLLALLLQAIYGIRSERMLIEQLDYNLLFRWFVGLNPDDPVWHPTTFTKNRDRLLNEELMAKFLELLLAAPEVKPLLSSEHFSVDGTLLRAWASHSSLERIDGLDDDPPPPSGGNGFVGAPAGKKRAKGDFRGLLLSNQTHRSASDGEARLFKKAPGVGWAYPLLAVNLIDAAPRTATNRPRGQLSLDFQRSPKALDVLALSLQPLQQHLFMLMALFEQQLIQGRGGWSLLVEQALGLQLFPPGANHGAAAEQGELGGGNQAVGHGTEGWGSSGG